MLSDPLKIKIGATEKETPRTNLEGSPGRAASEYTSPDGLWKISILSTKGKRSRQTARVDVNKITENPFISTQNVEVSMSFYIVFDRPPAGFTSAEALEAAEGFLTLLKASSSKVLTQIIGGEV